MLDAIRTWAAGWTASILIGLLVLAFASWGIGDMFTGRRPNAPIQAGELKITPQDFLRAYEDELDLVSRRFGRRLRQSKHAYLVCMTGLLGA